MKGSFPSENHKTENTALFEDKQDKTVIWSMRGIVLFFLFLPCWLSAENRDGVVTIFFPSIMENRDLRLYAAESDESPIWHVFEMEELNSRLHSVMMYGGRPFISLRCDKQTERRYYIRDLEHPAKGYWIDKDSLNQFQDWHDWFFSFGDVSVGYDNPFRRSPSDTAAVISRSCHCSVYMIDSMAGDWVKLVFNPDCEGYFQENCPAEKKANEFWVLWRWGDRILLDVYIAE